MNKGGPEPPFSSFFFLSSPCVCRPPPFSPFFFFYSIALSLHGPIWASSNGPVWAWCIGLSLLFFGITEPNAEIDPKIQPHKETHIQATKPSLSNTLISIHQNPLPYSSSKTHKSPLNKPKSDTKSLLRPQLNHLTYKKPTTHSNLH
jgi:hypothetical protein